MIIQISLLLAICYIIGSIPTAYIIGKLFGKCDIRQVGSGNVGATNVFRVIGHVPGIIVLIIDILKGVIAVLLARFLLHQQLIEIIAGILSIAGHTWTIFLKFKGGKGVATSLGVFTALAPIPVIIVLPIFVLIVALTKYVSLGSIIGAILLPFLIWQIEANIVLTLLATVVSVFILIKHIPNIKRLIAGNENKLWQKV